MRVLHLFSNSKWTGPAEPALNLCLTLRELGVDVDFACAPDAGPAVNKIVEVARAHDLEPILDFYLDKHRHPIKNFTDAHKLKRRLDTVRYDLLHCHLRNDHRIAVAANRGRGTPLVRSSYNGQGFTERKRETSRLLRHTAFLIEPSNRALEYDAGAFGFPRDRMAVAPGAVDTKRFDPARRLPDARSGYGIDGGAFVVGIVARMQPHRHYEDLFGALRTLVDEGKTVHAIVVGRGSRQDEVAYNPVGEYGLSEHVTFTGYLDGDEYVAALKAFDVKVFLMPGSDGTCRAVREAMALGKPVVAADRGMLAEIVEDGQSGIVFEGGADGLAAALRTLYDDPDRRRAYGENARVRAQSDYSLEAQAGRVLDLYRTIAGGKA